MNITTPYVKIDLNQVEKNIKDMINGLKGSGIAHRPHIKPHKSIDLAKLQIELGAKGITCAKLSEAEVMAEAGIDDILLAFPVIGKENLERVTKLADRVKLTCIIDSLLGAESLSKAGEALGQKIDVLIEIDGGIHRGGVQPGEAVLHFANKIKALPGLKVNGLFTYMGQIYGETSKEGIQRAAASEAEILQSAKKLLEEHDFQLPVLSGGSTPSSIHHEQLSGITESRAGNYIFYDMNAVHLGVIPLERCALRIRSQVVSVPLPGYASIDAGSKTLTSDGSLKDETFGYVVDRPGVKIVKLNEEHGFLRYDPNEDQLEVGDQIEIIPNHSCVILNLNHRIYGFRGESLEKELTVEARGMNY